MTDRNDSTCVLFGIDALVVKAVEEHDGKLLVVVETRQGPVSSPVCGV